MAKDIRELPVTASNGYSFLICSRTPRTMNADAAGEAIKKPQVRLSESYLGTTGH